MVPQTLRAPSAIYFILQVRISIRHQILWNGLSFQADQLVKVFILSHQLVHIGVRRRTDYDTYSFQFRNEHGNNRSLTLLDFKVGVSRLARRITACQKLPVNSHWQTQFFVPSNVQRHPSSAYPDAYVRSSSPPYKRYSTLSLPLLHRQQSNVDVQGAVPSSMPLLQIVSTALLKMGFHELFDKSSFKASFPENVDTEMLLNPLTLRIQMHVANSLRAIPLVIHAWVFKDVYNCVTLFQEVRNTSRKGQRQRCIRVLKRFTSNTCHLCQKVVHIHRSFNAVDAHHVSQEQL